MIGKRRKRTKEERMRKGRREGIVREWRERRWEGKKILGEKRKE